MKILFIWIENDNLGDAAKFGSFVVFFFFFFFFFFYLRKPFIKYIYLYKRRHLI